MEMPRQYAPGVGKIPIVELVPQWECNSVLSLYSESRNEARIWDDRYDF